MAYMQALMAVSTGISVMSAMQKGNAENTAFQMDAQQQELRLAQEKIIAAQRHNDRIAELDFNQSVNEAYFAFLGRDVTDASYKAFMRKNQETAYSDAKRSNYQSLLEQGQIRYARAQDLHRGAMAKQRSRIEAMNSLVTGMYNLSVTVV